MTLGAFVTEHPVGAAVLGLRYALLAIAAMAVIALCRRAGYGWAWALLVLLPVLGYPLAYYALLQGYATADEAEVVMTLLLAVLPAMLVGLTLRGERHTEEVEG